MPAFLSHSHEDAASYSTLCLALDGSNIARWDVNLLAPGLSLPDQLRAAVDQCEVCVFLATERSLKSKWCLAELGAFWGAGKRVIVFVGDPGVTDEEMPPQFQGNLRTTDARQLLDAVRKAINDTPQSAQPHDLLPDEHLKPLAADASHASDHIRLACAHTLWSMRPDRAKPILEDQLGDWCEAVRRHAKFLLDQY